MTILLASWSLFRTRMALYEKIYEGYDLLPCTT